MEELSQEIWQTIRRNKWRSLMTAFGVFWGLLMLILLVGLGNGIFNGISNSLHSIPSNSMIIWGGSTSMAYKGFGIERNIILENRDIDALQANFGDKIRFVTPINQVGSADTSLGDHTYNASVSGTTPSYIHVVPQQVVYGRYLNEIDLRERRKVCVIGYQVYEALFPQGGDPSGAIVKVGDVYYTVVGVVKKLTDMISFGPNENKSLYLPITTEQLAYNQGQTIHLVVPTFKDQYPIDDYQKSIMGVLKERHMVHPDDLLAISGESIAEIMKMFDRLFLGINILLWIVGGGSLLAGLIGISNIMLVTVKERTQEIGIRRALGAKPRTILTQILAESLVLTSAAGLTGLIAGVWILKVAGMIIANMPKTDDFFPLDNPQIAFSVAIAATLVIIMGGLLAGWLPANRAMKIKAIDALRDE